MDLVQLIYTSKKTQSMPLIDIMSMVEKAAENNAKADISGQLIFRDGRFLQLLEGPVEAVNRLYYHIIKDARHADPVLIHYGLAYSRLYEKWGMKYLNAATIPLSPRLLTELDESPCAPFPLNKDLALELLVLCRDS